MSENIYYTYILCDPRKPTPFKVPGIDVILPCEPFYIGMGHDNRFKDHVKRVKRAIKVGDDGFFNDGNKMKNRIVRDLLKEDLKPVIKLVLSNAHRSDAADSECYLIKVIGRLDRRTGILTNLTDGGEGQAYDRKVSDRKPFKATKVLSEKERVAGYSVIRYCPFTDTHVRFDSVSEVVKDWNIPYFDRVSIGNVCRGTFLQYKGHIFFWEKDFTPENLEIRLNNFFSQNPTRLGVARNEYRKRCIEQAFAEREMFDDGNKNYELKVA